MKDELRDDAIEVFPDKYPDEGDVLGWLKIYENDFIFGSIAEQAGEQIKTLTAERDVLKIAHQAHETSNLRMLAKLKELAFERDALKKELERCKNWHVPKH